LVEMVTAEELISWELAQRSNFWASFRKCLDCRRYCLRAPELIYLSVALGASFLV
jgi:hypothetical protein